MNFSGKSSFFQSNHGWIWMALVVLSTLLAISCYIFIRDVNQVHRSGIFHPQNPLGMIHIGSGKIPPVSNIQEVDRIDVWMTFSYINFMFHLPENYLKEKLHIDHPRYPKISLGTYIKYKKLESNGFIAQVKESIRVTFHPDFHY